MATSVTVLLVAACLPPVALAAPAAATAAPPVAAAAAVAPASTATAAPTAPAAPEEEAAAVEAAAIAREFDRFSESLGKKYPSPGERDARKRAFEANFKFIQQESAKNRTFELGLNRFADLSDEEFRATYLGLIRPNGTDMWGGAEALGTTAASGASVPSSMDWRKRGAMSEVKDQGGCGACWAFAAADAISAAWQIKTGRLVSLSAQQLLDCTRFGVRGCMGGAINPAYTYAVSDGLCSTSSYPYVAHKSSCKAPGSCSVAVPAGAVRGYHDVRRHNEAALMEAVARQPVSVGIEAEGRAFRFYKAGVYNSHCGNYPNHGVLLVGYGSDHSGRYWLLKNSWGPSWGEGGYFKLRRESSEGTGPGHCGIMQMPSYPVVRAVDPGHSPSQPPPSTRPTPPGGHGRYGRPPCLDDEVRGRIFGGELCASPCSSGGACPAAGQGMRATPQCILKERSWHGKAQRTYCALVCRNTPECPGGSRCVISVMGSGLCVYGGQRGVASSEAVLEGGEILDLEPPRRLADLEAADQPDVFV